MEHKWDEAYGYLYGNEDNPAVPVYEADKFLSEYVAKVNEDSDFEGIALDIYNAFKLGRAAIVAKDYELRDVQAQVIRGKISAVIGIRAIYYLQQGKANLDLDFGIYNQTDYNKLNHIEDSYTISNRAAEVKAFLYNILYTQKDRVINVIIKPHKEYKAVKQFVKGKIGKKTIRLIDLDEVNNILLETIITKFRNNPYKFQYNPNEKTINFQKDIILFFETSLIPANKEIDFSMSVATLQVPAIFSLASAKGPITAIVAVFFKGNNWFLFFNNTNDCAAIFLASVRFDFVKISFLARLTSQYL